LGTRELSAHAGGKGAVHEQGPIAEGRVTLRSVG
jgi:hypothetical protein